MICVQAKRYKEGSNVGRPDIQQFVGSLNEKRAKKGVFITTSDFSKEASDYISKIDIKIVLINGKKLVQLMYDYGVGVSSTQTYEIKRIDQDFFDI